VHQIRSVEKHNFVSLHVATDTVTVVEVYHQIKKPELQQKAKFFLLFPDKVFEFGVPRRWVGGVILVLRTFPELAERSVQNLVEIGQAVCG